MLRLLTLVEAAEWIGTSPRFPRRLVEERRIRFVRHPYYSRRFERAERLSVHGRARMDAFRDHVPVR